YRRSLASGRHEYIHATLHKFGSERRQPAVVAARPTVFDGDVLAVEKARFSQTFEKRLQHKPSIVGRTGTHESDNRPRRLLCTHRKRPSSHTPQQRDEVTPPHCPPRP